MNRPDIKAAYFKFHYAFTGACPGFDLMDSRSACVVTISLYIPCVFSRQMVQDRLAVLKSSRSDGFSKSPRSAVLLGVDAASYVFHAGFPASGNKGSARLVPGRRAWRGLDGQ
jgi:hypothetical protein